MTTVPTVKYSRAFWVNLGDRAVSTAAQTVVATLGVGYLGILEIDPVSLGSIVGLATVLAVAKAFAVRAIPSK
jgi:hypothetical protein